MAAHQWDNMAAIASVNSSGEYFVLEEEQRTVLRASLDLSNNRIRDLFEISEGRRKDHM